MRREAVRLLALASCWILVSSHPHSDEETIGPDLDHETHLYFHLLDDHSYVPDLRPAATHNHSLDVTGHLRVVSAADTEDGHGISLLMDITLSWHDARLVWNSSLYGLVTSLQVPHGNVWTPSVEAMSGHQLLHVCRQSPVTLDHSGLVSWVVTVTAEAGCSSDISKFPAEVRRCDVTLPLGHHHVQKTEGVVVHFVNTHGPGIPTHSAPGEFSTHFSHGWALQESSLFVLLPEGEVSTHEKSDDVRISLKLARHRLVEEFMVTSPVLVLVWLLPIVFLVPSDSSAKTTLGPIVLVAVCITLRHVLDLLPSGQQEFPRLVVISVVVLVLTAVVTFLSVVVTSLAAVSPHSHMPVWAKRIFFGSCGLQRWLLYSVSAIVPVIPSPSASVVVGVRGAASDLDLSLPEGDHKDPPLVITSSRDTADGPGRARKQHLWLDMARILDRLFFVIFTVIALFTTISLLS
ncbi:acetylcholine receptor subunit alpha [Aplysia californica]|uniref:Acetylcholine receptor subunit alpha n=1 Tax=Aplysia californica TaxID=6500 RepID=A0ABM1ACQ0_APLCA|nr:acetylcholine receptor subunit alpha [Aplysia californica]